MRALLWIPFLTYAVSYVVLAVYHGESILFRTIVHEGGTYTLWQTILFASHFLGHIPVHTVLALYLVGVFLCLTPTLSTSRAHASVQSATLRRLLLTLLLFTSGSLLLSLYLFGLEDTLAYTLQQRQRVGEFNPGGSWTLHLPSTILMLFFIPPYCGVLLRVQGHEPALGHQGLSYIGLALGIILFMSLAANFQQPQELLSLWADARYQGHSVREIATFPLTYFPIPLYFFLRALNKGATDSPNRAAARLMLISSATVFFLLFGYQVVLTLAHGVSNVAYKPDFAGSKGLSIPYLLASHYFEHVLDTIFFALLAVLLYVRSRPL